MAFVNSLNAGFTFPLVADRTVARYCAAIITFSRDSLSLLTAHSAIGDQSAKIDQLQKKIELMEVALAAQQAPGVKRKRRQHAAAQEEPLIQVNNNLTLFANQPFC